MSISSIARGIGSWVRKNPVKTVGIIGGVGLITYAATHKTKQEHVDAINHMAIANPILNPTGWLIHAANPACTGTNALDNPLLNIKV